MDYYELTDESKDVLKGMVEHCLNNFLCMGMDEGVDLETNKDLPFKSELRKFVDTV